MNNVHSFRASHFIICPLYSPPTPRPSQLWGSRRPQCTGGGPPLRPVCLRPHDLGQDTSRPWVLAAWLYPVMIRVTFQGVSELKNSHLGLPCGPVVKNPLSSAGASGLIPVQEGSTCRGAAKPTGHNCWSLHALDPVLHNERCHHTRNLHTATGEEPPPTKTREPARSSEDPAQPINKQITNSHS